MIRAILFDVDGVLINGPGFHKKLNLEFGISNSQMQDFFKSEFKDCLVGKSDIKEVLPSYLKLWGWPFCVNDFLNYWHKIESAVDTDLTSYIKVIKSNGIKCYLATNQEINRANYLINELGFSKIFDKIYVSADIGYKKPSLEFFSHIINDLNGLGINEILYWDDSNENIEAALKLGINAELYTNFAEFKLRMKYYLNVSQVS